MKPVLTVGDEKLEIVVVGVKAEGSDNTQYFYDAEAHSYMDDNQKVNLSATIENPKEQQLLLERLEKTLDESMEYLTVLKLELADKVIENLDLPFPNATLKSDVEEIKSQISFIEGLEHAIEIAKGKYISEETSEVSSTE